MSVDYCLRLRYADNHYLAQRTRSTLCPASSHAGGAPLHLWRPQGDCTAPLAPCNDERGWKHPTSPTQRHSMPMQRTPRPSVIANTAHRRGISVGLPSHDCVGASRSSDVVSQPMRASQMKLTTYLRFVVISRRQIVVRYLLHALHEIQQTKKYDWHP